MFHSFIYYKVNIITILNNGITMTFMCHPFTLNTCWIITEEFNNIIFFKIISMES